jgi:hypothetical protein
VTDRNQRPGQVWPIGSTHHAGRRRRPGAGGPGARAVGQHRRTRTRRDSVTLRPLPVGGGGLRVRGSVRHNELGSHGDRDRVMVVPRAGVSRSPAVTIGPPWLARAAPTSRSDNRDTSLSHWHGHGHACSGPAAAAHVPASVGVGTSRLGDTTAGISDPCRLGQPLLWSNLKAGPTVVCFRGD